MLEFLAVDRVVDHALIPARSHPDDAGLDLCAAEAKVIPSGAWGSVRTGVRVDIPAGFVGLVHPRSGLALRHGVTVLNAPGTVDAGYHGEIQVILMNHGPYTFSVDVHDRVAQLIIQQVSLPVPIEGMDFQPATARGVAGFGSTGMAGAPRKIL